MQASNVVFIREEAQHGWRANNNVWLEGIERGNRFDEWLHEVKIAELDGSFSHLFVKITVRAQEKRDSQGKMTRHYSKQ